MVLFSPIFLFFLCCCCLTCFVEEVGGGGGDKGSGWGHHDRLALLCWFIFLRKNMFRPIFRARFIIFCLAIISVSSVNNLSRQIKLRLPLKNFHHFWLLCGLREIQLGRGAEQLSAVVWFGFFAYFLYVK